MGRGGSEVTRSHPTIRVFVEVASDFFGDFQTLANGLCSR
jgi:hypothetical protein